MSSDGMDISLIRIDKKTNEIIFSGAGSQVLCIKNKSVTKYDGNILPIGFQKDNFKYSNQTIEASSNALLYLYTDGYSDQLSSNRGKKLGSKRFAKLMIENALCPFQEKEDHLKAAFNKWRGERRQIDDVCIIGVKI